MKTSQNGIDLIKKYEGCRLTAYKAVSTEKYYTIGYGHYGSDVTKGMTITKAKAEELLKSDLAKFEKAVAGYNLNWINQNRFDALVSFAYNCGTGNLKSLLASGTRTAEQVSAKITAYNKAGGKVLAGLTKRRKAEKELFDTAAFLYDGVDYAPVFDADYYKTMYSDVAASGYGKTDLLLFQHFTEFGMKEGRRAHANFNVAVYRANNKDLADTFGDNLTLYYKHYCIYGKNENRKAF